MIVTHHCLITLLYVSGCGCKGNILPYKIAKTTFTGNLDENFEFFSGTEDRDTCINMVRYLPDALTLIVGGYLELK